MLPRSFPANVSAYPATVALSFSFQSEPSIDAASGGIRPAAIDHHDRVVPGDFHGREQVDTRRPVVGTPGVHHFAVVEQRAARKHPPIVAQRRVRRQGGGFDGRRREARRKDRVESALFVQSRELPDPEPDEQCRAGEGDGQGEDSARSHGVSSA